MKKVFKKEDGTLIDLVSHTKEILADKTKNVSLICVGTDSQNKRYNTCFVTVVTYHYGGRGAHCIYFRENVKKIRDRYTRLWGEVERSVEVAKYLAENNIKVNCVELDFNQKEFTGSNSMVKASRGYVLGMGMECGVNWDVKIKPDENLGAIKFADNICRK